MLANKSKIIARVKIGGIFVNKFKQAVLLSTGAVALGILTLSSPALAQPGVYDQAIKPKEPAAVLITAHENASASTDEHQLLARLKGLVLVNNPRQVMAKGTNAVGVQIRGSNIPAGVAAAAAAYVGMPVSPASLDRMSRDMVLAYRAAGLPVVNVVVPPQDITNGVVQVVVIVAHLGNVTVEGNAANPEYYTDGFGLASGDVISEAAVVDQLAWKSRRANRHADAIYSPGSSFGTTNIAFDVKETKPWSVFVGADNTGSGALGSYRFYTGFVASNLWGHDNELAYQYTTSEKGPAGLSAHALTYTLPVRNRTDFELSGSYVTSKAVVGPSTVNGTNWGLGGQFNSQLGHLGPFSMDAKYGVEYKNSNNNLAFGGASVTNTPTVVAQAFAQIFGQRSSGKTNTKFNVGVWASPGHIFANNNDAAFNASRAGSVAEYIYSRASFDETVFLPKDFMFNAKLQGQLASSRLINSEVMYLGGMNSVRGFNEDAVGGDNGLLARLQLYSPAASLMKGKQDALRAFTFFDAGYVSTINPVATEGSSLIAGAGVGLSYQYSQNLSADVAYGWRVKGDKLITDGASGALNFRVQARF